MSTTFATSLEERAASLERDAHALRKLQEVVGDLGEERVVALLAPFLNGNGHQNGHAETPAKAETKPAGPRGREAIRQIVHERPGIWTLAKLRNEMKRRHWFTSNKGVDVAVTRLVASGEARRVGKGRYEFPAPEDRRLL